MDKLPGRGECGVAPWSQAGDKGNVLLHKHPPPQGHTGAGWPAVHWHFGCPDPLHIKRRTLALAWTQVMSIYEAMNQIRVASASSPGAQESLSSIHLTHCPMTAARPRPGQTLASSCR